MHATHNSVLHGIANPQESRIIKTNGIGKLSMPHNYTNAFKAHTSKHFGTNRFCCAVFPRFFRKRGDNVSATGSYIEYIVLYLIENTFVCYFANCARVLVIASNYWPRLGALLMLLLHYMSVCCKAIAMSARSMRLCVHR